MNIQKVVGIAFIKDNKLLLAQSVKSKKTDSWTLIGGGVEEGETLIETAIREVREEIHNNFFVTESDLELVLSFREQAASDPTKTIDMNIFLCHKDIDVELTTDEEIIGYHWYTIGDDLNISLSIKNHFLPFALKNKLIY